MFCLLSVLQAIQRVRTECQKVASMQLFHVPMSKTQRLEEFDQTQSQASNQVTDPSINRSIGERNHTCSRFQNTKGPKFFCLILSLDIAVSERQLDYHPPCRNKNLPSRCGQGMVQLTRNKLASKSILGLLMPHFSRRLSRCPSSDVPHSNRHQRFSKVYQISKLKKFMDMVKFSMQDSLRYLVQDSLNAFVQVIHECWSMVVSTTDGFMVFFKKDFLFGRLNEFHFWSLT